jgi:hypothetical protein
MNVLFIEFLGMFVLSIAVIGGLVLLIKNKKVTWRDLYVSLTFSLILIIFGLTLKLGYDTNKELSTQFKVTKEIVSNTNFKDSTINDSLLYDMIIKLRIPHGKIVFAQAKLESGKYNSELYKANFNLFGMKYAAVRPTVATSERYGYQLYDNWKESVVDLLIWQFSNNVDRITNEKYLQYLQVRYAEDPNYMAKLIKIIKETNYENLSK